MLSERKGFFCVKTLKCKIKIYDNDGVKDKDKIDAGKLPPSPQLN